MAKTPDTLVTRIERRKAGPAEVAAAASAAHVPFDAQEKQLVRSGGWLRPDKYDRIGVWVLRSFTFVDSNGGEPLPSGRDSNIPGIPAIWALRPSGSVVELRDTIHGWQARGAVHEGQVGAALMEFAETHGLSAVAKQ